MTTHPFVRATALAVAAAGLTGLTALAPVHASPTSSPTSGERAESSTQREIGNVIECIGRINGKRAYVSLYENDQYVNVIQVVIGDNGNGHSREVPRGFIDDRTVRGSVQMDRQRAVVRGTARRVGKKIPVHEEIENDAGQRITIDGFQRRIVAGLTLRHGRARKPLTCDTAFHYNLKVTKEDLNEE